MPRKAGNKKKEELKNVALGLSDKYDEDAIWSKYAISLANVNSSFTLLR